MTDWSALGADPAPGDSGVMHEVAQALSALANNAYDAARDLSRIASGVSGADWTGGAATAAHDRIHKSVPGLFSYSSAQRTAADAINTLANVLPGLQQRAQVAARDASEADHDLGGARAWELTAQAAIVASDARLVQHRADLLRQQTVDIVSGGTSAAQLSIQRQLTAESAQMAGHNADVASARKAAGDATKRLNAAKKDAAGIRQEHTAAVRQCAGQLDRARDEFLIADNPIQMLLKDIGAAGKQAYKDIVASKEFEQLLNICDVASTVLTVVAIVCVIIPGLQPVAGALLLASTVLSAVVLVGHIMQMANGSKKWDFVGLALGAAALVPGFGKAGKLLRSGSAAVGMSTKGATYLGKVARDFKAVPWAFRATPRMAGRSNARAWHEAEKKLTKVFPKAKKSEIVRLAKKFGGEHAQVVHRARITGRVVGDVVGLGRRVKSIHDDIRDAGADIAKGDIVGAAMHTGRAAAHAAGMGGETNSGKLLEKSTSVGLKVEALNNPSPAPQPGHGPVVGAGR